MDDRLLMENYLLVLKSTVEVYVHGTLEILLVIGLALGITLFVRKLYSIESKTDVSEKYSMTNKHDTYNLMSEYGWYPVNNVDKNEILNTLNKENNQN